MSRPLILVSNDDGAHAAGIGVLARVAGEFGDVIVSAPSDDRSGVSHSISLHDALRVTEIRENWFAVTGTPVDCVYVGALHLCPRPPDLVLSGINHGFNLGSDVYYSGTVGAAREGLLRKRPALAVSVERGDEVESAAPFIRRVLEAMLARGLDEPELLNLNVPSGAEPDRIAVTRLGERVYRDQVLCRKDLQGRNYYWIGGPPDRSAAGPEGTDVWATAQGWASVTPIALDCTSPTVASWNARLGGAS